MEEKLSKSILYNLNILKHAVPCSRHVEDALVEGIFLKSNTNHFIHITQYLFTIIDSKEFKKKFYWPIVDKRSENAYRTSAVEFINSLLDKHNLPYEKIKQVNVVHPSGKKFMALILELLKIAIKEVLTRKYKCNDFERSLDVNAALKAAEDITQVEADIQQMLKEDVKVIKERSNQIQHIVTRITGIEDGTDYEEFMKHWLAYLKDQSTVIEQRNVKINEMVQKSQKLFERAQEMMGKKEFKVSVTPNESLNASIASLIENMKNTLPVVKNIITNYPVSEAAVTEDETKIINQKLKDLEQLDSIVKNLKEKYKILHTSSARFQALKEESRLLGNDTLSDNEDDWMLSAFAEFSHDFDPSKNCVASIDHKSSNQLALLDENDNILRAASHYPRNPDISIVERTFKAPSKPAPLPSRRRQRRDPMDLLNKATSSTNHNKNQTIMQMENSIIVMNRPTSTPIPFSSTMRSNGLLPGPYMLNFSTVSNISVMSHISEPPEAEIRVEKPPMEDITNMMPKIEIKDATVIEIEDATMVQNENFGRSGPDEDLFNISDSCLVKLED